MQCNTMFSGFLECYVKILIVLPLKFNILYTLKIITSHDLSYLCYFIGLFFTYYCFIFINHISSTFFIIALYTDTYMLY